MEEQGKGKKRGFAAMDPAKQAEIARLGGKAVHAAGKGHCFSPEKAREAGRKGGLSRAQNREAMKEIGSRGGKARIANLRKREAEEDQTLLSQK